MVGQKIGKAVATIGKGQKPAPSPALAEAPRTAVVPIGAEGPWADASATAGQVADGPAAGAEEPVASAAPPF